MPALFVAVTVNVYAVPFVRPVTVQDSPPDEHVPPGLAVTVYAEIVAPPVFAGALHDTTTCVLPLTPLTPVGASGSVAGVTAADAVEAVLVPALFVAVTVNVYAVPFVRPVTVQDSAPDNHPQVWLPELAVTVYAVIVDPPVLAGALHDTTTCVLPRTPDTLVGAPGTVAGVTAADGVEALLVPKLFVAVTVNVYAVPFVRPVTVQESASDDHEQVPPPELAVTVYAKITAPPVLAGALHDTTTSVLPRTPLTPVGAPGVPGVTAADAVEALLVPTLFVAVTVNVYAVPFVRPVTVQESAPSDHEHVPPPELAVTVYAVIADPPTPTGASHDTTTCVLPLTPDTLVGAPGTGVIFDTLLEPSFAV